MTTVVTRKGDHQGLRFCLLSIYIKLKTDVQQPAMYNLRFASKYILFLYFFLKYVFMYMSFLLFF